MVNKNIYELKINKSTYDVISANTPFYAFMGNRLYSTFDKMLSEISTRNLPDMIAKQKRGILTLIAEDGTEHDCLTTFLGQDDTVVDIKLLVLDDIQGWEDHLMEELDKKNHILSLYGDYFFEYMVAADSLKVYAIDRYEQTILSTSMGELEKKLLRDADETNEKDVHKLLAALKSGSERFVVTIPGDILNIKNTAYTLIKGLSYYEDGKHAYTVGSVHLWNENRSENTDVKRALERDYLTGVLTKAEITNLAINTIDVKKTSNVTLAIIDIDYFKKVNDVHGHQMGDEVLKKVASIIQNEVREDGLVGRFGGDEFLVIFYNAYDMENMRERLRSIKNSVASGYVRTNTGENIFITLSIGCAAYPKDADNYEDLFFLADAALYRAKEKGRDRYIIYGRDKHGTLEEIKNKKMSVNTLNNRGDMSPAELICAMQDKVYTGQDYPLDKLLDDVALNLNIQRVMLYSGHPVKLVGVAGANRLSPEQVEATRNYLESPALLKAYDETGVLAIDNIRRFESSSPTLYEQLAKQGILSFVHVKFKDKNGVDATLSLEFVKSLNTWNRQHFTYFRLLAKLLSEYKLSS